MSAAPFLFASLAILLTPGPTNTLLAASGAALGMRRAIMLPLAEAVGYVAAISLFLAAAGLLEGVPAALPILKAVAALWLLVSAAKLWSLPTVAERPGRYGAVWRVLVTTMLNPKAMLIGSIVIPGLMAGEATKAVISFAMLSILAGAGWVAFGAVLPVGLRRHAYRGAAMILAGFACTAIVSAIQS